VVPLEVLFLSTMPRFLDLPVSLREEPFWLSFASGQKFLLGCWRPEGRDRRQAEDMFALVAPLPGGSLGS